MRPVMLPMARTALCVEVCTAAIWLPISSVAFAVCTASAFTSEATTAKPLPAGARPLDRGVERQKIGLSGHALDELDHVVDLLRRLRQVGDVVVRRLRLGRRGAHHFGGARLLT